LAPWWHLQTTDIFTSDNGFLLSIALAACTKNQAKCLKIFIPFEYLGHPHTYEDLLNCVLIVASNIRTRRGQRKCDQASKQDLSQLSNAVLYKTDVPANQYDSHCVLCVKDSVEISTSFGRHGCTNVYVVLIQDELLFLMVVVIPSVLSPFK
jgi:hypothetical protein